MPQSLVTAMFACPEFRKLLFVFMPTPASSSGQCIRVERYHQRSYLHRYCFGMVGVKVRKLEARSEKGYWLQVRLVRASREPKIRLMMGQ